VNEEIELYSLILRNRRKSIKMTTLADLKRYIAADPDNNIAYIPMCDETPGYDGRKYELLWTYNDHLC